ncbi:MAG: hypothetical protein O2923_02815 [Verrucomicrobia bacterium]|nr:hypothetical protein [Verrucomicrobiota bacterium]MDA1086565.1 hypothetical protein [Verrucomicrobiota bacterium]
MATPCLIVHSKAGSARTVAKSINRVQHACIADVVSESLVAVRISEIHSQDRTIWETLTGLANITSVDLVHHDLELLDAPDVARAS